MGRDHFLNGPPLCLQRLAQLPRHLLLIPLQTFLIELGFWNGSAEIILLWCDFNLEGESWVGLERLIWACWRVTIVLPCLIFSDCVLVVCWCFSMFPLELTSPIYISTILSFTMFLLLIINDLTHRSIFWNNLSTPLFTKYLHLFLYSFGAYQMPTVFFGVGLGADDAVFPQINGTHCSCLSGLSVPFSKPQDDFLM